jgi:hypothetical protein
MCKLIDGWFQTLITGRHSVGSTRLIGKDIRRTLENLRNRPTYELIGTF